MSFVPPGTAFKISVAFLITGLLCDIPFSGKTQDKLPAFKVVAYKLEGLNAVRESKMEQALQIFEKVMNDADFKKELLSLTFAYDVSGDPNRHLTTKQAVEKLYAAKEWYKDTSNNTADICWEIKKQKKPFFTEPDPGYEVQMDSTIYTYTWFFDKKGNIPSILGYLARQWTLELGFEHAFKPHRNRQKTVPFAFGELVEKYAAKYPPAAEFIAKKEK